MNTPRPAQWNNTRHTTTRMPTAPFWGGGGGRQTVGGGVQYPPVLRTPLQWRGTWYVPSRNKFPSAEGWREAPGWSEISRIRTYSPLSSRAKHGDPVNKKYCGRYARRHYLHSKLYTLHSIIVTLCVTIISLCAQRIRAGIFYSASVPTDIVMRRMPLLMDFSLFTRA